MRVWVLFFKIIRKWLNNMDVHVITTILSGVLTYVIGMQTEGCFSPQYLEIGEQGIISCHFEEGYYVILWFDSNYDSDQEAILTFKADGKTGKGLQSGEFDILSNGSLIIKEVELKHDHDFSVIKLDQPTDPLIPQTIRVIVTAKPSQLSPNINNCGDGREDNVCFIEIDKSREIICSVLDSRPAVKLDWFARTISSDENITSLLHTTEREGLFTTHVSASSVFQYSSVLVLLVCKAVHPPKMLEEDESMVLVQNRNINASDVEKIAKYFKKGENMRLQCNNGNIKYVVWNIMTSLNTGTSATMTWILSDQLMSSLHSEGYMVDDEGSLIVPDVDIEHEGIYRCTYGDGFSDGVKEFSVSVYVPSYPIVEGCNAVQYCTLEVPQSGHLRCTVKGIRPQVTLRWRVEEETESKIITFFDQSTDVINNGDSFDVSLTSKYNVNDLTVTRITIKCEVSGTNAEILDASFKFDLHFKNANQNQTTTISSKEDDASILWIIAVVVVIVVVACIALFSFIVCRRKKEISDNEYGTGEGVSLMPSGKKEMFIDELKRKYQNLYNEVQPVPYIRDRMLCVDKVFVEGGIKLISTEGGKDASTNLPSYHDIFKDSSTRTILEGDPGYGKSTLSLQLVYDWCQSVRDSPLKNIEILIFLHLRQLGDVKSIFKAIQRFILPIDSQLSEEDVSSIIYGCNSVVVVLDGFDEYPDQEKEDNDVMNILKGEMMQRFKVFLTTRTSNLPKTFAAHTKRLILTGFNGTARNTYIRKAVVSDETSARKLKGRMEKNPVIGDLCQVPLFFVMFAHMIHEKKKVYDFKSVTMCFRHVISCFHSHMRNKLKGKEIEASRQFEKDHQVLDEVAFKALSGKMQKIVWNKEDFCKNVSNEFYNHYIRIGILVETDVLDFQDFPGLSDSGHIQYKKEVRFYHKLFCEWYAAHYLAYKVIPSNEDLTIVLENMNPYDLQYLYRFSCGVNPDSAKTIIQHVKSLEDGDKFAVLCTLEQTGKADKIKETIQELFTGDVIFSASDSKLLQRSTIQLLEIASANDITIERVELYDCIESVNVTDKNLIMKSGIHLSNLTSVNELVIYEEGRELTFQEAANAVRFASQCQGLNTLGFYRCMLPQTLRGTQLCSFDVWWSPGLGTRFRLNLQSGRWEKREGGKLTESEYHDQMHQFNQRQQNRRADQEPGQYSGR